MEALEEITKAKSLLQDGLITDDEFRILKAGIISKLGVKSSNENVEPSYSKTGKGRKVNVKESTVKTPVPLTKAKPSSIKECSTNTPKKDKSNSKFTEKKQELVSKSQRRTKREVLDGTKMRKKEKSKNNEGSYRVKRTILILVLISTTVISFAIDPEDAMVIGLLGGLIAFAWWAIRIGKRSLFFFYAPYLLFTISFILFIYGSYMSGEKKPDDEEAVTLFIWVFLIVELLAFLFEYFLAQPKCSSCGKRSGMKKISESDFSSYDYIGTKTYNIRSKGGEKIGEYEGPVSRTAYNFTAHYQCNYCKTFTSRWESEHYDN